jgi:hypothetical protein
LVGDDTGLASAFSDELIAALAPFRWPSATCTGYLSPADFLLSGTIQRESERTRIALHLVSARAGHQVAWARTFDLVSPHTLVPQGEIAAAVAAQIDAKLVLMEAQRAVVVPTAEADAGDLILGAMALIGRLEHSSFLEAGKALAQAVALAPNFAEAHAWRAYWHLLLVQQGWTRNPSGTIAQASGLAARALGLDDQNPRVLTIAGHVQAQLCRNVPGAVALHQQALLLNPNLPMAWAFTAAAHACGGDLDEGARCIARYRSLSAMEPHGFFLETELAIVHLLRREHLLALSAGRTVTATSPGFVEGYKPYLAALGHLELSREAAAARECLLRLEPDFSLAKFLAACPIETPGDREHYAAGLRRAGIPK